LGQVTIFSGVERRRRWSEAQKLDLLARAFAPGAVLAHVAQDADIRPNQLYRWRAELRGGAAKPAAGFAQVVMTADARARDERPAIRVRLGSACVDIADHAPAALVSATLKALAR
jgi:transposase